MQFKMKNTSIKISFTFLALVLLFFITGNIKIFLISFLCAFIHEATHIVFIYLFSGEVACFSLSIFGANVQRKNTITNNLHEAIVAISAPSVNILVSLVSYYIFDITSVFTKSNFILGIINILPFHSFDGGCFIKHMLRIFATERTSNIILKVTSVTTTCVIAILSVFLTICSKSIHPLTILSLFMILSLVLKN